MKKTITVRIYNKEDYFSFGEWEEVEMYLEENGITEQEFENLQRKVNLKSDVFSFQEEESDINEFLKDRKNPNSKIFTEIYERLWNTYNLEIIKFRVRVLSIV